MLVLAVVFLFIIVDMRTHEVPRFSSNDMFCVPPAPLRSLPAFSPHLLSWWTGQESVHLRHRMGSNHERGHVAYRLAIDSHATGIVFTSSHPPTISALTLKAEDLWITNLRMLVKLDSLQVHWQMFSIARRCSTENKIQESFCTFCCRNRWFWGLSLA